MKIKTKQLSYEEVQKLTDRVHKKPAKPNRLVKKLVLVLSAGELKKVGFTYERECVRDEIKSGTYKLDIPVGIKILKDFNAIYEVGEGRLTHDVNGFKLTGCGGKLEYIQSVKSSYSLYSDYFWYELGDMICIGDNKVLYYCFPKSENVDVAKARLATEEMYKLI